MGIDNIISIEYILYILRSSLHCVDLLLRLLRIFHTMLLKYIVKITLFEKY